MTIQAQVHDNFKLFTGKLDASGNIGAVADEVAKWVASAKIAPKSIGIEFVESTKQLILSVGYRKDEPAYNVKLASSKIGMVNDLGADALMRLEHGMTEAASKQAHVICHELYVTDKNELYMVTMSHA